MPATGAEPNTLHEWQECRATIARFDGYLADTRKYGFTLVTVLLTANALVSTGNTAADRPAASIVVMTLVFALFMLDNYYWDLLRGAVDRAKELEKNGKLKLTGLISQKVRKTHATNLVLAVYGMFLLVAAGIGLTAGSAVPIGWRVAVIAIGLGELAVMLAVFLIVQKDAPNSRWFRENVLGEEPASKKPAG